MQPTSASDPGALEREPPMAIQWNVGYCRAGESLAADAPVVSNCLESQAICGSQRRWCRTIALRMVSSFRMQAVMATLKTLPAAQSRS
jgi:hypothetical protein